MLSYQHIYHAGNVVDCQKHLILSALLQCLREKKAPYCYIDTHSGRGVYDLAAAEAQKISEYEDGIARIWDAENWPEAAISYRQLLVELNPNGGFRHYPGSPFIAADQLRPQDRAIFYELHPQERVALAENVAGYRNVQVRFADGWAGMLDVPPAENRGLVFIDPSYELKGDYIDMPMRLTRVLKRWRNGIYIVWYPLLAARRHEEMLAGIVASGIRKVLRQEIITKDDNSPGLYGTGLLVINPPWGFDDTMLNIGNWLTPAIGMTHNTNWLVPE